jgi:ABC-type polysaccharide/polyol phosphate export permease
LIQVAAAVVLREWRVQRRYPISMVNLALLTPLYQLALPTLLLGTAFLVGGASVGLRRLVGTTDLAGWVGLGVLAATLLVGAVTSVYSTLEADRSTGVIEHSWASPASREAYVVGGVLTGTLFAVASSIILLGFAITVLHASYSVGGALTALPVLLVMVVANAGYSYLVGAAQLGLRRADAMVDAVTLAAVLFAGVSFPLTLMPHVARWLTYLLPSTLGLDLIRHLTLSTRPLLPIPAEIALGTLTSLVWLAVGRWTFLRTERRLRATGSLAQF